MGRGASIGAIVGVLASAGCAATPTTIDAGHRDAFVARDAWRSGLDASIPIVDAQWPDAWLDATDAPRDAWVPRDAFRAPRDASFIDTPDVGPDSYYMRQGGDVTRDCGVPESCNDLDDDCDGLTDEGIAGCVAVACGASVCVGMPCCDDDTTVSRYCGGCAILDWAYDFYCDGPEDCPAGSGCCAEAEGDFVRVDCQTSCASGTWQCHAPADCPPSHPRCVAGSWVGSGSCM